MSQINDTEKAKPLNVIVVDDEINFLIKRAQEGLVVASVIK